MNLVFFISSFCILEKPKELENLRRLQEKH
uniref:Uncharacterized protein n=1 Tax=Rhizophora mucronata TaxID=61149 RepID=A0A2P2Q8J5_RHIMU